LLSRESFTGTVRFLFPPSEEAADEEGISGAPRMIADGAMDNVDYVLALHVDPSTKVGDIALLPGVASAGVDTFYATLFGVGGHGAYPHKLSTRLPGWSSSWPYGIVSRRIHPLGRPSSASARSGRHTDNVIPDRVGGRHPAYLEPSIQKPSTPRSARSIRRADTRRRLPAAPGRFTLPVNDPPVVEDLRAPLPICWEQSTSIPAISRWAPRTSAI
jgi:hypothetical protein